MERTLNWYIAIILPLLIIGVGIYSIHTLQTLQQERQQSALTHFESLYGPLTQRVTQPNAVTLRATDWQNAVSNLTLKTDRTIYLLAFAIRDSEDSTRYGLYSERRFGLLFPRITTRALADEKKIGEHYITRRLSVSERRAQGTANYYTAEALYALLSPADWQPLLVLALLAGGIWLFGAATLLWLHHIACANRIPS